MKTAVQFGAGNIGRGLMGQLFQGSGYQPIFVESNRELVERLNDRGEYPLFLLDGYTRREIRLIISPVRAIGTGQEDAISEVISSCDAISTAVGVKSLPVIAPLVARGLVNRFQNHRPPINIFLCENRLDAASLLHDVVLCHIPDEMKPEVEEKVGFVGMTVARMVPAPSSRLGIDDPLLVVADSYHTIPYDQKAIRGGEPIIAGLKPVVNFPAEVERKLFTHNLGHATLAYLGYLKGYAYVHEPFQDPFIDPLFDQTLDETTAALLRKYPGDILPEEQREVRKDIKIRFGNPLIMDTVQRVGRDPLRKLGPEDRLVGGAHLCLSQGIFPAGIAYVCGAALSYDFPGDEDALALQRMIRENGLGQTLQAISGIEPQSELGQKVMASYADLQEKRKDWVR